MFIPMIYIYLNEIPLRFQNKKEAWIKWHMNHAFFVIFKRKKRHDHLFSNYALLIYQLCRSEGHLLERAEKQVFISKSCDAQFSMVEILCSLNVCVTVYRNPYTLNLRFKTAALFQGSAVGRCASQTKDNLVCPSNDVIDNWINIDLLRQGKHW